MTEPDDDLTLDGNALAGLLSELLTFDATSMLRSCAGCGQQHPLGAHRAYRSAGVVLRCPHCEAVGVVIAPLGDRLAVQTTGTFLVERPR